MALSGTFEGLVEGYHKQRERVYAGKPFELIAPSFEGGRELVISQKGKVIKKVDLYSFHQEKVKGYEVRVYDAGAIELEGGLDGDLPEKVDFGSEESRQTYEIIRTQTSLGKYDSALIMLQEALQNGKKSGRDLEEQKFLSVGLILVKKCLFEGLKQVKERSDASLANKVIPYLRRYYSPHSSLITKGLEVGFQCGVERGDFSLADKFISLAREFHSSHKGLGDLIADVERERISLSTRRAYQNGLKVFSAARLEMAEKYLEEALKGANAPYRKRIVPRLEYLSGRLYLKYRIMGFRSYNQEKWARAGQYFLVCLKHKASSALVTLVKNQILPKVSGNEKFEMESQLEGLKKAWEDLKEKKEYEEANRADQDLSTLSDYKRAIQAYEKFLDRYPHRIYAQTVRERIRELKKELKKLDPTLSGFTYLRTATYSCGGSTNTVHEYRHDKTGLEFVLVPGGSYTINSKQVKLSSYLIGKTEVTQGVWKKVMGTTPWSGKSYVKEGDSYPVVCWANWQDCRDFCQKAGLRLPTEVEWEVACRAGTTTTYYWGDSMDGDYAWYDGNSGNATHPVAQKKPNAFGLYDMAGNVWERQPRHKGNIFF